MINVRNTEAARFEYRQYTDIGTFLKTYDVNDIIIYSGRVCHHVGEKII